MTAAGQVPADLRDLAERVTAGDRRALARAITLVESTRTDSRAQAAALLDAVLPSTGHAVRVGAHGTPGSGKSTFIEALGSQLTAAGHRVAVLAVDPSSRRSGGSILGDKTRMDRSPATRTPSSGPSPSGGTLGGVARRTREAVLLCEAAGFDVVLIETVGVGQSEVAVADMVDCFVLVAAGRGRRAAGHQAGIMELADVIVVNKADGDLLPAAGRAVADHRQAVHLMRPKHPGWTVPVVAVSALDDTGVDEAWAVVRRLDEHLRAGRARSTGCGPAQAVAWMWAEMQDRLVDTFRHDDAGRRPAGRRRGRGAGRGAVAHDRSARAAGGPRARRRG